MSLESVFFSLHFYLFIATGNESIHNKLYLKKKDFTEGAQWENETSDLQTAKHPRQIALCCQRVWHHQVPLWENKKYCNDAKQCTLYKPSFLLIFLHTTSAACINCFCEFTCLLLGHNRCTYIMFLSEYVPAVFQQWFRLRFD